MTDKEIHTQIALGTLRINEGLIDEIHRSTNRTLLKAILQYAREMANMDEIGYASTDTLILVGMCQGASYSRLRALNAMESKHDS